MYLCVKVKTAGSCICVLRLQILSLSTIFLIVLWKCSEIVLVKYLLNHMNVMKIKYILEVIPDISKYDGPSDLTDKNQASPMTFSAYRSESPVKICSLLRSGNNFLFVGRSNSVFKSRSFLQ